MRRALTVAAVVVLGAAVSAATVAQARTDSLWSNRPAGAAPLAQVPDFSTLAAELNPAVVSIKVRQKVKLAQHLPRELMRPFGEDFFRFFGPQGPQGPGEREARGVGSGFVIASEGLILTNHHVVENAEQIEVTFARPDGSERTLAAKVVGSAPDYDVALIATEEPAGAPIAYLGDSETVRIGDWVMAVGNPFGLSHSVSVGIISAKGRRDIAPSGRRGLYDFLQTDASINPGNSGGPLVNMRGEVIGINSAINAAGQGIGFAIPINMVKTMLPQLKESGRFARSWIGVKVQPLTEELAASYGLDEPRGALVSEVVDGGPAAKAGVKDGDIIVSFGGKPVRTVSDLPLHVGMRGAGQRAELQVWRDGKLRTLAVELKEFPDEELATAGGRGGQPEGGKALGLVLGDLTPQAREQLGLAPSVKGAVIRDLEPSSPAARVGLRPGDVVLSFNGQEVSSARKLVAALDAAPKGSLLRLKVAREGGSSFVAFRKP